jgi:hypothetical protein
MPCQELLGEALAALEAGHGLFRAKTGQSRGFECVHDAGDQRSLRSDDGEADVFGPRQRDQACDAGCWHRDVPAAGFRSGARVAGRDQHLVHSRRLRELPCERVFAPAAADDEDLQAGLNAGNGACR